MFTRFTIILYTVYLCYHAPVHAQSPSPQRIITLSPHLTEIVYALDKQGSLIAVSDHSDFPKDAATLLSVASYEGANIAEIMRLRPTHVLVWRGGNKDADIAKLKGLGFKVYESRINSIAELITDISAIGDFLAVDFEAEQLTTALIAQVKQLQQTYLGKNINAVYYLNEHPLVGLGNDTWLNSLLALCGIHNIYVNNPAAYPQLQISHIIRQQPALLIGANRSSLLQLQSFWQPHHNVLKAKIISANPDALHRFTPRAIGEITQVCKAAYASE